jgi:hypothetical protein
LVIESKHLEATALLAEKAAADAQADADAVAHRGDKERKDAAATAQAEAEGARKIADAAAARAAAQAASAGIYARQLAGTDRIRGDAYSLRASDEVNDRFKLAQIVSLVSVGFVAIGVILLGLAPEPKPTPPSAASVSLVTLDLSAQGQAALGCSSKQLSALRTGGTDEAPEVITLPDGDCPAKTLTFATAKPKPLGTMTAVEPVKPGS